MKLPNARLGLLAGVLVCTPAVSSAQVPVLTNRFDNGRTGANLSETQLTTSNVSVNNFGKLWSYSVDGSVYAQPLYVPGLSINGGTHNVLYVATMNDKVYALDADSNALLWCDSLISDTSGGCQNPVSVNSGTTPVLVNDILNGFNTDPIRQNIIGNVGILSTPVIDAGSGTMYVVARTHETGSPCGLNFRGNSDYCQKIHALDITTGAEKFGGPKIIGGTFSGVTFDPLMDNQRTGLALANGHLFIAWASHEDACLFADSPCPPSFVYHGWVMSYSASTLGQTSIFCVTPPSSNPSGPHPNCTDDHTRTIGECGHAGGIWQSGRGPAVDSSGNVYYMSGNGGFDGGFRNGGNNYGESLIKFSSSGGPSLVDYFTPSLWEGWNQGDTDFASGGPMLVPGTNLIVGAGKSSTFYLLDTSNLGGLENTQDVQTPFAINGGEVKSGPAYWNRSGGAGPWMYVWADQDFLKAYHFNGSTFDTTPVSTGTLRASTNAGGVVVVSANGSMAGTGIVWASMPTEDANGSVHPGVLHAYNAADLTAPELWNSVQNQARDDVGRWGKFNPPTVDNGKVYIGSFPDPTSASTASSVSVYGLFDFSISATPASRTVNPGGGTNYTVNTASVFPSGFPSNVTYSVTGLPAGATASFSPIGQAVPGTSTVNVTTSSSTPAGTYTLTITGTGGIQTHTAKVTLIVSYNICLLYNPTQAKKSGSTYPIKIQICDVNGNNLSSALIVVQAQSVTMSSNNTPGPLDDSGNSNPDFDFRFDSTLPGYIYNLSLQGISTGTYKLNFMVSGDPVPHSVPFQVK